MRRLGTNGYWYSWAVLTPGILWLTRRSWLMEFQEMFFLNFDWK